MLEIATLIAKLGVTGTVCGVWAYVSIKKMELVTIPIPIVAAVALAWGLKIVPGMLGV